MSVLLSLDGLAAASLLALLVIGAAVIATIAGIVFYVLRAKGPDTAERAGDDLAEAVDVMSDLDGLPGTDGSHDDLAVDAQRWAAEMALLERAWSPEVPIIPGRLPGENR